VCHAEEEGLWGGLIYLVTKLVGNDTSCIQIKPQTKILERESL
jgi:hypothetical protein